MLREVVSSGKFVLFDLMRRASVLLSFSFRWFFVVVVIQVFRSEMHICMVKTVYLIRRTGLK